ncbi:DUF389 domain-containing protein [Aestuariibaculum suncheonense]|uniref:DUF389 domain-containing protein n=1 Tax=Aestuariibaculum suncheonense TaxID=1028745 RepID=A0A8J6Q466_9FLAO|nr:DUF389 domain-containing protein [Aestuariibaculum suncheonense]MBD0834277.1 DUF389 domain-containing protein [Aestuariibaculum suncheonense]
MEENKFNFAEEEKKKEQIVDETKEAVKKDAQGLLLSIKRFFSELLDFRDDTDREATIQAIKNDIPFKGATAWILVCSIFVASIGLNANSTAVVIGAMLISPLMGPILGIGLSVSINDIDTLRKSLVNFGVMIVLSVITAFLFFWFFPLSEESSELLARTQPDIRDVLIAFFGGSALIIARTKKGTIASVIFGVAIATALMPPLCTVGYGLSVAFEQDFAKGGRYALGALYLFIINTIFIALATFLVLKVLKFPMLKYANSARRRRISRFAMTLAIVVMIPALWTFVNVLKQSRFEVDASNFVKRELTSLPHSEYIKKNASYKFSEDKKVPSTIELNTFGLDEVPESTIALLQDRMLKYDALKSAVLIFNQNKNKNLDNLKYMEQIRYRDSIDLLSQSQKIVFLESKLKSLEKLERLQIPFDDLTKEVKILYEGINKLSYSSVITSNFNKTDTLSVITAKWDTKKINEKDIASQQEKLEKWLRQKYKLDSLVVTRQ